MSVNYKMSNIDIDLSIFNNYVSEGFKAIRCKGYTDRYNPDEDYKTAKEPIEGRFTKDDFEGMSCGEAKKWIEHKGWIGWLIPEGYIAIDVEDDDAIEYVSVLCKSENIQPAINKTNNGNHFLFKDNKNLPASTTSLTKSGFTVTNRAGGKNYLVLPPINNRIWEIWKPLKDCSSLPEELEPLDKKNGIEILNAIAIQVGFYRKKSLSGYDDIDTSLMAMLMNNGIALNDVKRMFKTIYKEEYEEDTTVQMYTRTRGRIENDEEVKSGGSFIQKLKEENLHHVVELCRLLGRNDPETTEKPYFKKGKFIPKRLADELMSQFSFIYTGEQLYVYQDGVYRSKGEDFIRFECRVRLQDEANKCRINEVICHIIDMNKVEVKDLNKDSLSLINVKNGMLDWRTGELLPHDVSYLSIFQVPVEFNPQAECPEVEGFLNSSLPEDCLLLTEEIIGYCLIPDVRFERAFMLVGTGSNGKSTFLHLLNEFLGDFNVAKVPLQELCDHKFKRAGLFGKLANIFSDLGSKSLQDSSYFKALVSGDVIDAERKFVEPFYFKAYAKLIFSANKIPKSSDKTYAFYRRWIIIQFPYTFTDEDADRNLISKLKTSSNLSGLLNRAIRGLQRLFENGSFSDSETTRNALDDYRRENDSVAAFIHDCCEFGCDFEVERKTLFFQYEIFCESEGLKKMGKKYFYEGVRGTERVTEIRDRLFRGIRLRNENDEEIDDSELQDLRSP